MVPEIRGKAQANAFSLLSSRHLCPEEMPAEWPAAAKARLGTIVDQDPTAGARVDRGARIRVWVRQRAAGAPGTGQTKIFVDSVNFC